ALAKEPPRLHAVHRRDRPPGATNRRRIGRDPSRPRRRIPRRRREAGRRVQRDRARGSRHRRRDAARGTAVCPLHGHVRAAQERPPARCGDGVDLGPPPGLSRSRPCGRGRLGIGRLRERRCTLAPCGAPHARGVSRPGREGAMAERGACLRLSEPLRGLRPAASRGDGSGHARRGFVFVVATGGDGRRRPPARPRKRPRHRGGAREGARRRGLPPPRGRGGAGARGELHVGGRGREDAHAFRGGSRMTARRRRVLLDARKARDFGIGTYIRGLLSGLAGPDRFPPQALVLPGDETLFPASVTTTACAAAHYSFGELVAVRRAISAAKPDLFHAPHYVVPFFPPRATVVTIHDLMHLTRPEHATPAKRAYARWMIGRALRLSARVIAVSEATKREILAFGPEWSGKAEV